MGPQDRRHAGKNAHLVVTRGLLDHPSGDAVNDGARLARRCLSPLLKLPDFGDYPPQLLVLLTTVGFQPFDKLLKGIAEELGRNHLSVPLVGCSVAGVLTEEKAMPKGAALVCLSSQFVHAHVGVARDVLDHRQRAVASLVRQLGLRDGQVNPSGNRFLLCFLSGFLESGRDRRYEAAEILAAMRNETRNRIPMVGGVAGDDFQRKGSWQFADDAVHTQSAVTALVESDLRFGIAMSHGLAPTGRYVYVKDVADNRHRIVSFAKAKGTALQFQTPKEVIDDFQQHGRRILFGMATSEDEGEEVVLFPQVQADGSALVNRPVKQHWPLEVLACVPERLHGTAPEMIRRASIAGNIDPFHLACIIAFPCAARSEYAREMRLDVPTALKALRESHPRVPMVAGLVFGEVGLGAQGRPVLGSWSISGLLLSDQITSRSLHRLGYRALAPVNGTRAGDGKPRTILATAESIEDVLAAAIDVITEVGFPGSMISLVFHDRHSYVIVARKAHSKGWERIIRRTIRRAEQGDLLDVVGRSGEPKFIPDSRRDPFNDSEAVSIAGVISQYVLPLKGPNGTLIGLLQIDLGDMSNERRLPEHLETLLRAFASQIATALSRAIRMHELALSDLFDRAVAASLTKSTVVEAAQEFVNTVVSDKDHFKTDMVHVRLVSDDRKLQLVAGSGRYYRVAQKTRPVISVDEDGPSARAFRDAEPMWVNDVKDDVLSRNFIAGFRKSATGRALRAQRSYVNLLIRARDEDPPVGIINIAATTPWFFSESLWRSLKTLGQRLFLAVQRAKKVEAECRIAREREFLLRIWPPLSGQDLRTSLREHAEQIASAANADVVSFFLWDPERKLLVLRGQYGWKKDMIGKAVYERSENPDRGNTMTGTVAALLRPEYIPHLAAWKRAHGMRGVKAKYGKEMFGGRSRDVYEVIAIPLRFREDLLGVLTMHNIVHSGASFSGFATTNTDALIEVARDISAFVFATQAHEATSYREQRATRMENFGRFLLKPARDAVQVARQASSQLKNAYSVGAVAIYLASEDSVVLSLAGSAGLSRSVETQPSLVEIVVRGTVLGRVFKHGETLVARRDDKGRLEETLEPLGQLLSSGRMNTFLALPLRDDFREPLGLLAVWNIRNRPGEEYPWFTERDIDEFRRLASGIARAIERRKTESRQAKVANELRDSERRLLYGAAIVGHLTHDLRNRMNEILSDVRTLVDDAHNETERERLTSVEGTCGGLAIRVDEHLDAIARGGVRQHEDFDLRRTLQRVIWRCEEKAKRHGVTIKELPCPEVILRGSEMDFEEAFFNVADNGINAMEDGGKLTVGVSVEPAKRRARITIVDTGEGMTKEEIAEALGGFYKTGRRERPAMGLFLAKFVIERHGGTLLLTSKRKKGTTTTMTLPIQLAGD